MRLASITFKWTLRLNTSPTFQYLSHLYNLESINKNASIQLHMSISQGISGDIQISIIFGHKCFFKWCFGTSPAWLILSIVERENQNQGFLETSLDAYEKSDPPVYKVWPLHLSKQGYSHPLAPCHRSHTSKRNNDSISAVRFASRSKF